MRSFGILLNHEDVQQLACRMLLGEELFPWLFLLREMGIHTDVSLYAQTGHYDSGKKEIRSYPAKNMDLNEKNYIRFEGKWTLKDYCKEENGKVTFDKDF